ncbi:YwmB family TATA-box binding protein [Paenibacillus sp. 1781tsa1]|uniref:YwmB family TATA-box binding protein n=1 Tax=Paenibacillus sp. 1781tsa1 TaxID=2953810 RepID=UPI00209ED2F4|nr:YwmB family TATA-box binding protein [Paenibacillus sp. 1781tsa1]MCP1186600.1 YwmB family TATA-box binding protein [Paenibacillus sp. 1781tsa1]
MLNRWMTAGILAMAIIILIGVTQVYAEKNEPQAAQLEQLIYTADSVIDNVDRLVVKWQGEGRGDAQAQAALLASHLGLEQPVRVRQTGHNVYRSEVVVNEALGEVGLLVNVVETGDNGYYAIVQLSADAHTERKTLMTAHEQIGQLLVDSGMKASWNMSVQGTAATAIKRDASQQLALIEKGLSQNVDLVSVERYTDVASASVSYEAAELPLSIKSGSHMLNMQLAVHQVGDEMDNRITVGFPVITIEY